MGKISTAAKPPLSLWARIANKVRDVFGIVDTDGPTREFIKYNRRRFRAYRKIDPSKVVLVGIFGWKPSVCVNAVLADWLARRHGCAMELYSFKRAKYPLLQKVYGSFGARLTLTRRNAQKYEAAAEKFADEAMRGLHTKADLLKICVEDMVLGDLIYDTYMRVNFVTQPNLTDPNLGKVIKDAYLLYYATRDYFDSKTVLAVVPHDPGFLECSVPQRFAIQRGIPLFWYPYNPLTALELDSAMTPGDPKDHRNWPLKVMSHVGLKRDFEKLTPEEQESGRLKARAELEEKLAGKIDTRIMPGGITAYKAPTNVRILHDSAAPRVVVLLHCACDNPNVYRSCLFSDFEDWTEFLLSRAEKTGFNWYVKPHPHSALDEALNQVNVRFFEKLKSRFPKVHFLTGEESNRQIIEEGVNAMFTVHGTAGHEYAYLGVPVVNAGDNPHIEFGFNLHAKTLEEYERYIFSADALPLQPSKREVEEFYYMRNFYPFERSPYRINLIPEEWIELPERIALEATTETYTHFVRAASAERDRKIDACFDSVPRLRNLT